MAGTITVDTVNTSTGIQSTNNALLGCAKAWVNFNGVSGAAIRSSYNVSSVTRTATGVYTITLTTAMSSSTYSVVVTSTYDGTNQGYLVYQNQNTFTKTASAFGLSTFNVSASNADSIEVDAVVFGNG